MDLQAVVDALRGKFQGQPQSPQGGQGVSAVQLGLEGQANARAYRDAQIAAAEQGQQLPPFEAWVQQFRGR